MKAAIILTLAMMALCASGRPYLPSDCPTECHINNIQPVCAAENRGTYARLKTFATSCEIRKFNCEKGTSYVFLFNGGCPFENP